MTALWARVARLLTTTNRIIVTNAGSLVGTTAVTAVLGYAYWGMAARQFSPAVVGVAAAAVTAMALLGTVGMLGFGTLLIGLLPRQPGAERHLIGTALMVAGGAGTIIGAVFAGCIGFLSADLAQLGASPLRMALFGLGVGLTSLSMVLDQALIGLLRGELQLSRNIVFAVVKLGALGWLAVFAHDVGGFDIFLTWAVGIVASLVVMVLLVYGSGRATRLRHLARAGRGFSLRWDLVRSLGGAAAGHHALNLALQAPPLALPLIVTAVLSAATNAYFYTAWMIAAFVFVGPFALTTALYAAGARDPTSLKQRIRLTLGLSMTIGITANLGVLVMGGSVLSLFGAGYAEQAAGSLRILALEVFPLIVKDHYVTISRLEGKIGPATAIVAGFGVLRLAVAAGGAVLGGLEGLAIGWVGSACVEAILVAGPVVRTAISGTAADRVATEARRAARSTSIAASVEVA